MATKRCEGSERNLVAQRRRTPHRTGLPLLVAWPGTEGSAVVDVVTYLAQTLGERVIFGTVANAFGPPVFPSDRVLEDPLGSGATASERSHAAAQRLRDRGIDVAEVVLGGDPTNALISEAVRLSARAIIIGQRDAEYVIAPLQKPMIEMLKHQSPCPVRVVPRSGEPDGTKVTHDLRVNASISAPLAPVKEPTSARTREGV